MGLAKTPQECLVCLNKNETIFVPNEESQKIFNICCYYVKGAINIEFLIKNVKANNNQLSFCKSCFNSSLNISQLAEKLSNLKKEIDDLSRCFSETIEKQRIQAKANQSITQLKSKHTKFCTSNNQMGYLDSPDKFLSLAIQNERGRESFSQSSENELLVQRIANTGINSCEIFKTESDGRFLEYEDVCFADNVSGYKEDEYVTNYLVTENENEIDPLGEVSSSELSTFGIVDSHYKNESNHQFETLQSVSESASSAGIPNIVVKQIENAAKSIRSNTFDSPESLYQEKPGVNFNENGSTFNSTTRTARVKRKEYKIRKIKMPYSCSICQKKFRVPCHLRKHFLNHTGEKPYKCSFCDKAYKNSSNLKIHERIHTGEKPYHCSWCENSFKRLDTLKDHERIHNGDMREKSFKCSNCEMTFYTSSSLKNHEKTHTRDKYHNNNQRQHTAEAPFKCYFCERKFKTICLRGNHEKKFHKGMQKN